MARPGIAVVVVKSMGNKNVEIKWLIGGMLLLAYAGFVKVTGNFFFHEDYRSLLSNEESDSFGYYFNLIGSTIIGTLLLYRSLLFIPSNRKFQKEHPEYLKKRAERQKEDLSINPGRLLKVIFVILVLFGLIMIISKLF